MPAAIDWAEVFAKKLESRGIVPPEKSRPSINRRTAFHVYRAMGPKRSLTALARALEGPGWEGHASVAELQAWSEAGDWPRACAAWDAEEEAKTAPFDELSALQTISGKFNALTHHVLDEEDPFAIDTETFSVLTDTMFSVAERIHALRKARADEALKTGTNLCFPQVAGSHASEAPYESESRKDHCTHRTAEVPWPVGDNSRETDEETIGQPYEAPGTAHSDDENLGGAWQSIDPEEESGGEGAPEETLADFVGSYLDDLPEEYRHVLSPSDGKALRVLVSQYDGRVHLHIYTDKHRWVNYITNIPIKR